MRRLLILALALPLFACQEEPVEAEPTPTPTPEPVEVLPPVIPLTWLENLSGTIVHHQEYTDPGALAGTTCDESFEAFGANISGHEQNACAECEMVFTLLLSQTSDCLGDDVLEDSGELGLDLRQTDGESVFWWYNNGLFGWGAGWDELGTGTVTQNVEDLTLDVHFEFADPRNDNNAPWTADSDDCGWLPDDHCVWNGTYIIDLQLEMDPALIEWELEYPEE